jgi:NADH-quinone oxidoreductase subunit J
LFLLIASLGVLAALGTVLARNLVRAALFLVAFFFLVACLFVLMEAEFLAAIQVLVYIGAVAILILFGIMLTRNIQGDETTRSSWVSLAMCGVAALSVLAVLVGGIRNDTGLGRRRGWTEVRSRPVAADDAGVATSQGRAINDMARAVGNEMMTRYVIPFEVAGLLLTASVVGAIALAMADPEDSSADRESRDKLKGDSPAPGPDPSRAESAAGEPVASSTGGVS